MRSIDGQVKFTNGKTPLLGCAMDEPTVQGLESIEDDYSGLTTNTPTKQMAFCPEIV